MAGPFDARRWAVAWRRSRSEEVTFPVTPMLDMAFQLLAFFILTFRPPSNEAWLDIELPARPVGVVASADRRGADRGGDTRETGELEVRATADADGRLAGLRLAGGAVVDELTLERRLARHVRLLDGRPVRVRLVADDRLRLEGAARLIGVMTRAGVGAVRLAGPEGGPEVAP